MKNNVLSAKANKIFKDYKIWEYIEDCYDTLHLNGDEYILNDIEQILFSKGVVL